jgi:hypothetical protein
LLVHHRGFARSQLRVSTWSPTVAGTQARAALKNNFGACHGRLFEAILGVQPVS